MGREALVGEDGKIAHDGIVARWRCRFLAGGPLFNDDSEVVELLDDGLDTAADAGAVLGIGLGGLSNGDDTAIAPGAGRQGNEGLDEVSLADGHLLAAGGLRAEHGALTD